MDNTTSIVPSFNGQLEHSTATLCDFFLITTEADVPVIQVVVLVDGDKHKFTVGPGKYKTTLFLLYCAVLKQRDNFPFDTSLKELLRPHFGEELVTDASLPETSHVTLQHLVIGKSIQVNLVLKPGYELPKGPGRTLRKLIEHGWGRYKHLNADSPVPLIRQAITTFQQAERGGAIHIVGSWNSTTWPSLEWQDRVRTLSRALGKRSTP